MASPRNNPPVEPAGTHRRPTAPGLPLKSCATWPTVVCTGCSGCPRRCPHIRSVVTSSELGRPQSAWSFLHGPWCRGPWRSWRAMTRSAVMFVSVRESAGQARLLPVRRDAYSLFALMALSRTLAEAGDPASVYDTPLWERDSITSVGGTRSSSAMVAKACRTRQSFYNYRRRSYSTVVGRSRPPPARRRHIEVRRIQTWSGPPVCVQ